MGVTGRKGEDGGKGTSVAWQANTDGKKKRNTYLKVCV